MKSWPDFNNGVVCGDCYDRYVLIRIKSYRTCRRYCETLGSKCLNAKDNSPNTCTVQSNQDCDTDLDWTEDALCQCDHHTITTGMTILYNKV